MIPVIIAPAARLDLLEIRETIVQTNGESVAENVMADFERAAATLSEFPRAGRPRPDLPGRGFRSLPVHSWLVVYIYRIRKGRVELVRVLHQSRNLRAAMRNRQF